MIAEMIHSKDRDVAYNVSKKVLCIAPLICGDFYCFLGYLYCLSVKCDTYNIKLSFDCLPM
jgi:hypothetical protein